MPTHTPEVLQRGAAESLQALTPHGRQLVGSYHRKPGWADAANEAGLADHLQGISVSAGTPDRFFLTTSAKGGLLLSGLVLRDSDDTPQYVVDSQTGDLGGNHPGGIQAIGDGVVVPVYDTNAQTTRSEIQLWSCPRAGTLERSVLHTLPRHRAYCAAITYSEKLGYLLAVGLSEKGRLLGLYRKRSDDLLDERSFQHVHTVRTRKAHRNNISLCADRQGAVFLLGFRLGGKFQVLGMGEDRVDTYALDEELWSGAQPPGGPTRVRRSLTRHLRCRPGTEQPSFRWGVSARALPDGQLEVVACGYQIFQKNHQQCFEVDVFRPDS